MPRRKKAPEINREEPYILTSAEFETLTTHITDLQLRMMSAEKSLESERSAVNAAKRATKAAKDAKSFSAKAEKTTEEIWDFARKIEWEGIKQKLLRIERNRQESDVERDRLRKDAAAVRIAAKEVSNVAELADRAQALLERALAERRTAEALLHTAERVLAVAEKERA